MNLGTSIASTKSKIVFDIHTLVYPSPQTIFNCHLLASKESTLAHFSREIMKEVSPFIKGPTVNVPVLSLFFGSWILWISSIAAYMNGILPLGLAFVTTLIALNALYSCMHEAVHGCLGSSPILNRLVGLLSSSSLMAPYEAFKLIHLTHHRHTNDPEKDPDFYSGLPFLVFRWATHVGWYYVCYLGLRKKLSAAYRYETLIQVGALILLATYLGTIGYHTEVLWLWVVPVFVNYFILTFTFNYLPHYPHDPETKQDVFASTCARNHKSSKNIFSSTRITIMFIIYSLMSLSFIWVRSGKLLEKSVKIEVRLLRIAFFSFKYRITQ